MAARVPSTSLTAVVLAAGESSRFWPLSTHGSKSLHRLRGQAIIEHTIESLVASGITEIIVVQSPISRAAHFPHRSVADQLGDGSRYGARIRYVDQLEASGQGDAILEAAPLLEDEFLVVQPENINAGDIVEDILNARQGDELVAAAQERDETWLFGVFSHQEGKVDGFMEKPPAGEEPSKLCNMGVYLLNREFLERLSEQKKSPLSHVEVLVEMARTGNVRAVPVPHPFFPLKYPWHLFAMAEHLGSRDGTPYIGDNVTVPTSASIDPACAVESDCSLAEGVHLTRCIIGAGSRIESSLASSILGAAVTMEKAVTVDDRPRHTEDAVATVKGQTVMTEMPRFGVVVGQGTILRAGSHIGSGVMIGAECEIEAGAVSDNVIDRTRPQFENAS